MTKVRMFCRVRSRPWRGTSCLVALVSIAGALGGVSRAAAPMILNHDNANRLIDATSAGNGAQFNYDANGNVSVITAASASTLTFGSAQNGQISTPGSATLFNFTTTTNQPAWSIDLVSTDMSPAGSAVQVDVYNASGTLVGSITGTAGTLLDLPPLPAGTYSVSVEGQDQATGSFQMQLINTPVGAPSDGPLPLWMYLVLGGGLLAMLVRGERTLGRIA